MSEAELPQRVRVVEAHVTSDPNPIRFRAGDTLGVGHHDQVWKDYVWGTDQAGRSGWVPDEYLRMGPDGDFATALRDYDSTELTVGCKQVLSVLDEVGGWYLCRTESGASGWVPGTSVEPVE
ncbi:MAG TPA: SH3 domain-containing protein [Thermoleophilia bacterium]|nr:SH3 domain-containing protein [Thermoleophilia bacterium]